MLFNFPIAVTDVGEPELSGWVMDTGGVNVVPVKADDFTYDPFLDRSSPGSTAASRRAASPSTARPPGDGGAALGVTLNTAHIGIILKQKQAGVIDIEGGVIERSKGVGEIFPLFRAIATDLNLPLAIALWSFIFVQLWGIQSLGLRTNFGKFIGMGGGPWSRAHRGRRRAARSDLGAGPASSRSPSDSSATFSPGKSCCSWPRSWCRCWRRRCSTAWSCSWASSKRSSLRCSRSFSRSRRSPTGARP